VVSSNTDVAQRQLPSLSQTEEEYFVYSFISLQFTVYSLRFTVEQLSKFSMFNKILLLLGGGWEGASIFNYQFSIINYSLLLGGG